MCFCWLCFQNVGQCVIFKLLSQIGQRLMTISSVNPLVILFLINSSMYKMLKGQIILKKGRQYDINKKLRANCHAAMLN